MMLVAATVYVVASAPRPWPLIVAIACYLALLVWLVATETRP